MEEIEIKSTSRSIHKDLDNLWFLPKVALLRKESDEPVPAQNPYSDFLVHREGIGITLRFCRQSPAPDQDRARRSGFLCEPEVAAEIHVRKKKLNDLSKTLAVNVHAQPWGVEADISARLLSPRVHEILRQIDFVPISEFLLSPLQMQVTSKLDSPAKCAKQLRQFQDLVTAVLVKGRVKP